MTRMAIVISDRLVEQIERADAARLAYNQFLRERRAAGLTLTGPDVSRAMLPYNQARALARSTFAEDNNWTVAKAGFSFASLGSGKLRRSWSGPLCFDSYQEAAASCLAPLVDHVDHFRQGRRPAAVVAHPYPSRFAEWQRALEERPAAVAAELAALRLEVTPLRCLSWYCPHGTVAVLVTPIESRS
jgi:hypothetical protein